jgi:hypothetical protein
MAAQLAAQPVKFAKKEYRFVSGIILMWSSNLISVRRQIWRGYVAKSEAAAT